MSGLLSCGRFLLAIQGKAVVEKTMKIDQKQFPILKQIQPSPEQTDPILERGKDIVVTAGAGTGKTRTLVARYLSFLAEGIPLRSIVAITFTKKAAREMRNRIRDEVRRFLENKELDQTERFFWREIYEGLDAARISTIHGLAADILHHHPAEMKLDPAFELINEGELARLKAQAVENALNWAADDLGASSLFVTFGEWSLRNIVKELMSKRLEVIHVFDHQVEDLWESWKPHLIQPLKEFFENPLVRSGMEGLVSLEEQGFVSRANQAGDALVEDLRIVINTWKIITSAQREGDWIKVSRHLGCFRAHLKQKGRKENWAPADPKSIIKEIQAVYDSLLVDKNLDLGLDQKLAQRIVPGLLAVFQQANHWYEEVKTSIHGLDYDDLEENTLQLLKNHPDALFYWQEHIQALLVDEFQDTNQRQRELVSLLNGDQKKLFIVGDGKQSIYRFRGADVAVFRDQGEKISISGRKYHLNTSYRAHPELLLSLNDLLRPVLGDESSLPYIEPFSPLLPGRDDAPNSLLPPYIELHLAAGLKSTGGLKIAAEAAAFRLSELVQSEAARLDGHGKNERRNLSYGDAAVLCRASGSFPAYEAAFEKAGIPYLTIAGQGFYNRPEIRDVLNALQALAEPQNDLTIAGLLRSPAGGLSDISVLKLRDFQRENALPTLLQAARQAEDADLGEDKLRAKRIVLIIDELNSYIGKSAVAEILWMFLSKTGYITALAKLGLIRSVQNLKKLITDAGNSGLTNISEFITMISELKDVAFREGEAQSVAEGAVQIMTVHQAKGLEFPIVILGDASKRGRYSREILFDERFGIVPPYSENQIQAEGEKEPGLIKISSLAYDLSMAEEKLQEDAESNRLLYVAATRAQELLIISGALGKPNKNQSFGKQSGWLGKMADPLGLSDLQISFQENGSDIHEYSLQNKNLKALCKIYGPGVNFEFQPQPVAELPTLSIEVNSSMLEEIQVRKAVPQAEQLIRRIASKPDHPTAPAWMVGELVHRALERWVFPDGGESEFNSWAEVGFRGLGLTGGKEIRDGLKRTIKNLERFQASELYQRMVGAKRLLHEIPFSLPRQNDLPLIGLIDALFLEESGWVLVEYKTDRIQNRDAYQRLWKEKDYQEQVEGYLTAAEQLLGTRPQPILCFLNYERRVHLITDRW